MSNSHKAIRAHARFPILLATAVLGLQSMGHAASPSGAGDIPTFVFGLSNEPRTLDPAFVYDGNTLMVLDQIYETLVKLEPGTTEIVPDLAESYSISDDGLTYEFKLRQNVSFHDGTPFDAQAVCFNFDRMYHFKGDQQLFSLSTFWQNVMGGFATQDIDSAPKDSLYDSCTVSGQHVATIKLKKSSGAFLPALASRYFGMVSPQAVEKYGDEIKISGGSFVFPGTYGTEHPTGTGPFKFRAWDHGNRVVLSRNDDYWGDKAHIETLIYKIIPDGPARRQALVSGDIDAYSDVAPQDIAPLKGGGFTILTRDQLDVGYLGMQPKIEPFDDIDVRKAVLHAINRDAVLKAFYPEEAKPANQLTPRGISGYNEAFQGYDYDPEQARKLLAESKYPNAKITFWYPTGVSRNYMPDPKALMNAFKEDLEKVGFQVTAKAVPWTPEYVAGIQQNKAPLYMIGRLVTYVDPSEVLNSLFLAGSRFSSTDEIVEGLQAALREPDREKRIAMYEKLNADIMENAPAVPFVSAPAFVAMNPQFKGYVTSPISQESLASVHQ